MKNDWHLDIPHFCDLLGESSHERNRAAWYSTIAIGNRQASMSTSNVTQINSDGFGDETSLIPIVAQATNDSWDFFGWTGANP